MTHTRRNISAIVVSAFVFSVAVLAVSASKGQVALAADAACPTSLLLETTNDHDYVAVFAAPTPISTGVGMTLYTRNGSYELARSSIAIATAPGNGTASFRSGPLLVADPSTAPFIAAAIRFVPDGRAAACAPVHVFISSAEVQKKQRFDDPELELRRAVATEANATNSEITPERASPSVTALPCTAPFSDARLEHAVEPDYPLAARLVGATGRIQVQVTLDVAGRPTGATVSKSSGSAALDNATLSAARRSMYRPA